MFGEYGRTRMMLWYYVTDPHGLWACNASHRDESAEAEHNTVVGAAEAGLRALAVAVRSRAEAVAAKVAGILGEPAAERVAP